MVNEQNKDSTSYDGHHQIIKKTKNKESNKKVTFTDKITDSRQAHKCIY